MHTKDFCEPIIAYCGLTEVLTCFWRALLFLHEPSHPLRIYGRQPACVLLDKLTYLLSNMSSPREDHLPSDSVDDTLSSTNEFTTTTNASAEQPRPSVENGSRANRESMMSVYVSLPNTPTGTASDDQKRNGEVEEELEPETFATAASERVHLPTSPVKSHVSEQPLEVQEYGEGQYKVYKRRWFGILSMALLNIANSWGWLSFSAISNYTADYFDLSSESPVNWLSTVILFSFIVVSPLVWWVLIKRGTRFGLLVCGVLTIIGNWLRYAGTVKKLFGLVMFGQILIGFAQPFALASPAYYTDIWFTSRSRVSANAIASLANPLGGAIAQLVGPAIVTKSSEMPTFMVITAGVSTACAASALLVQSRPPLPPCPSSTITKYPLLQSIKSLCVNLRFLAAFIMFSIYVGFFNAFSTYINQIMEPYGYSSDEAGYAGAILIVAGIVFTAVTSPLIDRFHQYLWIIKIQVPLVAGLYVAAIFMSTTDRQLEGPFIVCAFLGMLSFSLLPVFLEWTQEQTSPVDPAISSTLLWCGGQLFGAIFIIVMDALKYDSDQGSPPGNMRRSLIFEAVIACVGILPIWFVWNSKENIRANMDRKY